MSKSTSCAQTAYWASIARARPGHAYTHGEDAERAGGDRAINISKNTFSRWSLPRKAAARAHEGL